MYKQLMTIIITAILSFSFGVGLSDDTKVMLSSLSGLPTHQASIMPLVDTQAITQPAQPAKIQAEVSPQPTTPQPLAPPVQQSVPQQQPAPAPQPAQSPPKTYVAPVTKKATQEQTVYITRTGSKYHRSGCRYLSKSMIPISLSEASANYGPCSVCNPPR